jgi:hypothetical protein
MDVAKSMEIAAQDIRDDREVSKEKYKDSSKQRLENIISKKMRTTFIGALSQFEQHFGEMWGHGLPPHECTQEQLQLREVWQRLRNNVLNNGNHQLRTLSIELQQYDIVWNRYVMKLPVANRQA